MTRAVIESAVSPGKPKKLSGEMRDVHKHARDFKWSATNIVEALLASACFSSSVFDTTPTNPERATATPRLLTNIVGRMLDIDRSIPSQIGFSRYQTYPTRHKVETLQRLTQTPYNSYAWTRRVAGVARDEAEPLRDKAELHAWFPRLQSAAAELSNGKHEPLKDELARQNAEVEALNVEVEALRVEVE